MSYLPTFMNAWTAAGAAAIVVPLLLVLYFLKLRRREMAVSSTLLWKKAVQDLQVNAPFQRLRRNLLLFLQLALLLLLCLALARPIANYIPGAGKVTVILIDRSASMSAVDPELKPTRLEEAKKQAKALLDGLGRNGSAMVIAFDQTAETIQPFTSDVPALKRAIDSIQPTDRKSRLKLAYQLADAQTNVNPDLVKLDASSLPEVSVFSDGRVSDGADLSIRGKVHYNRIGSSKAGNIAIVAMNARRNYERPTEVQVFARLANYGAEPVNTDVSLQVDGRTAKIAGVSLPPERWTDDQRQKFETRDSVEFTVEMADAGVIRVEQMRKEGDALPADDAATVVVPPPRQLNVLLVSEGGNIFLEQVLAAQGFKNPPMLPTAWEGEKPAGYDVVIFDRYRPTFMPPAGNFIYFGAAPPGEKVKGEPAVYEEQPPAKQKMERVIDWKRDHPILRHLTFGRIGFADPIKLAPAQDVEVLMDGERGPLMTLHREGFSMHLVCAFSVLHSNWPLGHPSYPTFIYNALRYMAIGSDMDVRQSFEPGATPRIPRANLQRAGEVKSIRLNGPGGSKQIKVPAAGDFALPPLDQVGLYTTEPAVPGYESLAVNLLDSLESNVLPAEEAPGKVGEAVARTGGRARLELWWWIIACVALPLLIVEWWVYTRRVHL